MMERRDYETIATWIKPNGKVLDLGCGDGSLLYHLIGTKNVQGYGVEIDDAKILSCIERGVDVIQVDLEAGLSVFESDSFDYVILSQTLQAMRHTERIVAEMLRVGRQAIVTLPNFGYWLNRWQLLAGHMPKSREFPHHWYDTPNVHFCTLADFETFCDDKMIRIVEKRILRGGNPVKIFPNLLGNLALYRIERS
ncbi:MAG: methionine biosynthesis protein MetW [Proteobacteria bacterium]|nr:methionine biosynthesis protein MetW [Pseudomonadota bacterium]